MEPFEELGVFWLPGEEGNTRPGQLRFGHGAAGLHLGLFGSFEPFQQFMQAVSEHPGYPVIFGVLESGASVTLTGAWFNGTSVHFGGQVISTLRLRPAYVFRGAHLREGDQTLFTGFRVRFEHFDTWADPGIPVVARDVEAGQEHFITTPIPKVEVDAFGGKVSVDYWRNTNHSRSEVVIERTAQLSFESTEPRTLTALTHEVSVPLQNFLTFACGVPIHPLAFSVTMEGLGRQAGETWVPEQIEVGYNGWRSPAGHDRPVVMRLPLDSIRDQFGEVLRKWGALHQQQERSMTLLFAISLGLDLYVDTRFIFAVQAVELYHRRRWPGGMLSTSDHRARMKTLTDGISDGRLARWVKEKLAFSNEPSLRERLRVVLDYTGEEGVRTVRGDYVAAATDTRNYLTHYDDRLKKKAAEDEDLYVLTSETMALLELCFLRDLGFDSAAAWEHSAGTPLFQALLRRQGRLPPPIVVTEAPPQSEPTAGDRNGMDE